MDFLFGNKIVASLDIGSYSVKWAAIDRKRGLCHVWHGELFPERENRRDTLSEEQLLARLPALLQECQKTVKVWNKSVALSIAGSKVFHGYLELVPTTPKNLKFCVISALLNSLPMEFDAMETLCVGVPPLSGREDKSAAFYALLPSEYVERSRKRAEVCGLKCEQADDVAISLARAWGRNSSRADEMVALVHIGFERTTVLLARGGNPYYVRDFAPAGAQFTYAFQVGLQVSWAEAERRKRAYNVFDGREFYIEPDLRKWLEEVRRSLEHARSKHNLEAARVALSGGGAAWPGLPQRTEQFLGIPCELDGWDRLQPTQPLASHEAVVHKVSLGLALSEPG